MRPPCGLALLLLAPATGWEVTVTDQKDLVCTTLDGKPVKDGSMGGPTVTKLGGPTNIRSGPPDGVCRLKQVRFRDIVPESGASVLTRA